MQRVLIISQQCPNEKRWVNTKSSVPINRNKKYTNNILAKFEIELDEHPAAC